MSHHHNEAVACARRCGIHIALLRCHPPPSEAATLLDKILSEVDQIALLLGGIVPPVLAANQDHDSELRDEPLAREDTVIETQVDDAGEDEAAPPSASQKRARSP